jgi:ribosomal protein S1
VESFGAFVEIAPGVEGLLHVSQISEDRVENPKDALEVGQEIEVKITKIDRKNEKVSLSRREVMRDIEREEIQTYMQTGTEIAGGGGTLGELLRQAQIKGSANSTPVDSAKDEENDEKSQQN